MKSLYILAGQNMTLKTNSSGSPQDTISLTAGVPLVWVTGGAISNPFAGTITKFYLTAISTVNTGLFQMRLLQDATQ
jgi:hypothetical protein